jgi:hypothetical protein
LGIVVRSGIITIWIDGVCPFSLDQIAQK